MHYEHVAIEGNIGAGKTTLAKMMARSYDAELVLETFEANPFLPKFYEAPEKHAFPLELFFLAERYHQLRDKAETGKDLFHPFRISDYFIQKSLIFAWNNLKGDEYQLFHRLFRIMYESLPKPDLVLYLHKDPERLQENIAGRGRDYERDMSKSYLEELESGYFSFFKQHEELRVAVVDCNGMDFVAEPAHFEFLKWVLEQEHPKGMNYLNEKGGEADFLKS
ncbi:MAG: deoxynucleoside kinase [Flavobacteriales bacterium]